jgi:NCAIR mutase (PurE)-related protein
LYLNLAALNDLLPSLLRVTPEKYDEVQNIPLSQGTLEFNEVAGIISMKANNVMDMETYATDETTKLKRIIVATAGTTDLPVAEEAAVVLEAANCEVKRICDVGVAGLHRIINALPRLQDPDAVCIIVCARMDGALPSVVGGLVSVPVVAVPTSIGYGVSLGGISAMLTTLTACAPDVGVVNIDNGFGVAALAYKCVKR